MRSRDDVVATREFPIADLLDDGINDTVEMFDADGNSVGTVDVNINFEEGDGKSAAPRPARLRPAHSAQQLTDCVVLFLFAATQSTSSKCSGPCCTRKTRGRLRAGRLVGAEPSLLLHARAIPLACPNRCVGGGCSCQAARPLGASVMARDVVVVVT